MAHRVAPVNTDKFRNLVKISKIRSQQVHIKLVKDMKNVWFYTIEESATGQKVPSFNFLLGMQLQQAFTTSKEILQV